VPKALRARRVNSAHEWLTPQQQTGRELPASRPASDGDSARVFGSGARQVRFLTRSCFCLLRGGGPAARSPRRRPSSPTAPWRRSSTTRAVSHSCACIGSPCLRQCVHGASIGGADWLGSDVLQLVRRAGPTAPVPKLFEAFGDVTPSARAYGHKLQQESALRWQVWLAWSCVRESRPPAQRLADGGETARNG
jgi:hypothetical protein